MSTLKTKKTLSQCDRILQHLQSGKTINPKQAWNLFGCYRLGARIYDLKQDGYSIDSRIVRTENGKKYAEYSLNTNKKSH